MRLDLASVLVQWAAGGLLGGWITARRGVVGAGYGWLVRSCFAVLGAAGLAASIAAGDGGMGATVLRVGAAVLVVAALAALVDSARRRPDGSRRLGDARLDLLAPVAGLVALVGAADVVGGPYALSLARLVVGAAFLGLVTDAMLLGHWYLVQPGLSREPIRELVDLTLWSWPIEVAVLLVPTGMLSVLDGSIDDGYGGLLAWLWVLSTLMTLGLVLATRRALREPYYSAVMASTGLLYLAILTAFGTDVLGRALLAG